MWGPPFFPSRPFPFNIQRRGGRKMKFAAHANFIQTPRDRNHDPHGRTLMAWPQLRRAAVAKNNLLCTRLGPPPFIHARGRLLRDRERAFCCRPALLTGYYDTSSIPRSVVGWLVGAPLASILASSMQELKAWGSLRTARRLVVFLSSA